MKSSIVNKSVSPIRNEQFSVPSWGIVIFLVISLVILKTFIYIKDGDRHGK